MNRIRLIGIAVLLLTVVVLSVFTGCPKKQAGGTGTDSAGQGGRVVRPTPSEATDWGHIEVRVYAGDERIGAESELFLYAPSDHKYAVAEIKDGISEKVPVGKYDLEVVYVDDYGSERIKWVEGIQIVAGKTFKEKVSFDFGRLAVKVGGAGTSYTASDISVAVFPSGEKRRAVAEGWADSSLEVLVGTYDVLFEIVKGGTPQKMWERGIEIQANRTTTVEVNFSGGSLIVRLQGGASLPGTSVDIFSVGNRSHPIARCEPGEEIDIDPGSYDIRIRVGRGSKAYEYWEENVNVAMGKTNKVDIKLPVGTVKVNSFSSGGGQIAGTEFTVFVYSPGDSSNAILYLNGAETFTLDPGSYDIRVEYSNSQNKPSVWIKGLSIRAGQHKTLRADFEITSITTIVKVGKEELPGNQVKVYYCYEYDESSYAGVTISGVPAILESGSYKIKVQYTGGPVLIEEWAGTHRAQTGKAITVEHSLKAGWVTFTKNSGQLSCLTQKGIEIAVNIGDKILIPQGVYTLTTPEGEIITLDIGAGGKHEY